MVTYKIELFYNTDGMDRIDRSLKYALKVANKALKDNERMNSDVEDELDYIARSKIDEFYSYPTEYDRIGDLYNAYKVLITDTIWDIEYGSEFMHGGHRASTDYIFENSFILGYHGGAISGKNHPSPGTRYLRTPPFFNSWYEPAKKTKSPYDEIQKEKKKYLERQIKKYDKEIYEPLEIAINNLLDDIQEVLG